MAVLPIVPREITAVLLVCYHSTDRVYILKLASMHDLTLAVPVGPGCACVLICIHNYTKFSTAIVLCTVYMYEWVRLKNVLNLVSLEQPRRP